MGLSCLLIPSQAREFRRWAVTKAPWSSVEEDLQTLQDSESSRGKCVEWDRV